MQAHWGDVGSWVMGTLWTAEKGYRVVLNRLREEERTRTLRNCNEPKYGEIPSGQIVSQLADQGACCIREHVFT